jgi:hypothetical protein
MTLPTDRQEFSFVPDFETEVREMLAHQTINELRAVAKSRGFVLQGTRKDQIVEELARQLSDLEATRAEILALDDFRQKLLTHLHLILTSGYGLDSGSIVDTLAKRYKNTPRSALHSHIVGLSQRGLLLTFKQSNIVYCSLPQVVRACLPSRPDLVPAYPEQKVDRLQIRETRANTAIQTMYAVWNYIAEGRPRRHATPTRYPVEDQWPQLQGWNHLPSEIAELTRNRQRYYALTYESVTVPAADYHLRNADRRALRERTGCSDEESEFWYVLLEEIAAISGDTGEPIATHEEGFQKLLILPPSAKMYIMLYTWITNSTWSEVDVMLRSTEDVRLRRNLRYAAYKPQNLYQEWHMGRQAVVRFLSTLEENRWVSVDGFLQAIFEITPNIIHMHADPSVWWIESTKTKKQFGTTFEDWKQSYGRFVLATLKGPLAWLGAVSLGYVGNKLEAFKLTPIGSFALGRRATLVEDEHPVTAENALKMRDDLTVALVPGRVPAQFHDLLHLIGKLEEATPERFVYRITFDGVLLALEQGQTIETLIASLGQWCGTEIPITWQEKLHTWSQNYGKLHVYQEITLIELADDYALQELLINTSLREHLVYQFSPRLVAIRPAAVEGLVQEMERRGYTPRVE